MRITGVETGIAQVAVDRRVGQVADAKGFRFTSQIVLVRIRADNGLEGLGEANGSRDWSGETAAGARHLIDHEFAPRLIGRDPRDIRACLMLLASTFANPFAKAAIEMALFDLVGRSWGASLSQLLGGVVRSPDIPLRFPVFPLSPTDSAQVARHLVAEGFRAIKLKVGRDPLAVDLQRVRLVRAAIGDDVVLSVDANGAWSVSEAITAGAKLADQNVAFVEQPVHRLDLDGLAQVRRRIPLPVMADEAVFTPQDARHCIEREAADLISVYPGKNGGVLNTAAIVAMAEAAGVRCTIGSNLEWDVGSAVLAHVAAALPNVAVEAFAADIIGPVFHTDRAIGQPLLCSAATVRVPTGPGLGVQLNAQAQQIFASVHG